MKAKWPPEDRGQLMPRSPGHWQHSSHIVSWSASTRLTPSQGSPWYRWQKTRGLGGWPGTALQHAAHLAVPDLGVPVGIGRQDSPQRRDARFVLEGGVLRQGAVQVPLYLLRHQAALSHGLLHQVAIVTGMRGKVRDGIW